MFGSQRERTAPPSGKRSKPRTAGADRRLGAAVWAEQNRVKVERERSNRTLRRFCGANRWGRRAVEAGRVNLRARRKPCGCAGGAPAEREGTAADDISKEYRNRRRFFRILEWQVVRKRSGERPSRRGYDWMKRRKSLRRLLNMQRRASGLTRGIGRNFTHEFRVGDRVLAARLYGPSGISFVFVSRLGHERLGNRAMGHTCVRPESYALLFSFGNVHGPCSRSHGQHRALAAD